MIGEAFRAGRLLQRVIDLLAIDIANRRDVDLWIVLKLGHDVVAAVAHSDSAQLNGVVSPENPGIGSGCHGRCPAEQTPARDLALIHVRIIAPCRHYLGMQRALAILSLLTASLVADAGTLTKSHSQGKFSDEEIEATIKSKLVKSKIGKDGLQVHVKNGIATWTGNTSVMQHKGAATRMAKTAGATQVLNNIKVSAEGTGKATGNLQAEPRKVQVKSN